MTDQDIDRVVRAADPYDATGVDLRGADQALLEEIMSTSKPRSFRGRIVGAVAVAAALTAAIGVPALLQDRGHEPLVTKDQTPRPSQTRTPVVTDHIRFTSAAVRIAERNPRILVSEQGWKVRYLEGFSPTSGGMTFQLGPDRWHDDDGGHTNLAPSFDINWYPADQYEGYRQDRENVGRVQQLDVLGQRAQMISYSDDDHAVMLPPEGGVFIEMRGRLGDEAAFKRFLAGSIQKVGVREWLAALPAEMVTADNADSRLEKILADIPRPPGFEAAVLAREVALDRYQFGALVTGRVTCGWISSWAHGGAAEKAAAVKALATSHDWKILREMDVDGDYPEVVWEYADQIAQGKLPEGYRQGLGCE